jgi:hypothetical protein
MKTCPVKIFILCFAEFLLGASVTWGVFDAVPQLEDEHTHFIQAQLFA